METESDSAIECLLLLALALGVRPEEISRVFTPMAGERPPHRPSPEWLAAQLDLELVHHRAVPGARAPCDLPAMARLHDGTHVVLIEQGARQVLLRRPTHLHAERLTATAFAQAWTGEMLALKSRRVAQLGGSQPPRALLADSGVGTLHLAEILLGTCGLQLLGLATPLVFQTVIDKVLASHAVATLDVMCVALVAVAVFECVLAYLRSLSVARLGSQLDVHLGERFFAQLLSLAPAHATRLPASRMFARLKDLDVVRGFATGSVLALLPDVLFVSIFLAVMYHYSPSLTWALLLATPCLIAAAVLPGMCARKPFDARLLRAAETQTLLLETVGAWGGLKALAAEARQFAKWRSALRHTAEAAFAMHRVAAWATQAVTLVQKCCLVMVLWLGAHEVLQGRLTVGGLIAFNLLAGRALQPLLRLAQCWIEYQQGWAAWRRVRDFLQLPAEFDLLQRAPRLPVPRGKIVCERVCFRYGDERPEVLLDLNLEVAAGERVAVTGPAGSGKSTVLALIHGRYNPNGGRLLIDGIPLAGRDPRWIRRHIGLTSPGLPFVAGSLHDNIALRHPEATRAEVLRAARVAGIESVVLRLPHGLDTAWEGEPPLSTSELARLRLARALLGEPSLLLCDEGYEVTLAMLAACAPHQTCVVVSDHPQVLSRVDRILNLGPVEHPAARLSPVAKGPIAHGMP